MNGRKWFAAVFAWKKAVKDFGFFSRQEIEAWIEVVKLGSF